MDDQVKSREQLIAELQEIRSAYDELKAMNEKEMAGFRLTRADLVKAKEKVEQSDHYKTAFIASLSHELRTPLNGIIGLSQILLENENSDEDKQKMLHFINKGAILLNSIIIDLYQIAAFEAGRAVPVLSPVNVNGQLDYLFNFFKPDANLKGIGIFLEKPLTDEEATITSDKDKIHYVLKTLVNIAIKVTPAGSVTFGYRKKGDFLEFFVRNMGAGIGDEMKETVFEKFGWEEILLPYDYELTGMGLAVSRSCVELLGGRIWVENGTDKGSVFYFTIPYRM
ncbi:MAG: sensor histidine kinase [Bacteroidales bacterium]